MDSQRRLPKISAVIIGSLLTLLLPFVAACSGGDDASAQKAPPGLGNQLRLALSSEPETLDPHQAAVTTDWSILKQISRGLFWYDEDLDLVPMLASEIPTENNGGISSDGLVYRIKLRDDLFWSDGAELTAFDFEFSFKRLLDPKTDSPAAASFFVIRGAEELSGCLDCDADEVTRRQQDLGVRAEDTRTLVFTLRTASANFPLLLTTTAATPLRQNLIESHGDAWLDPSNLAASGPFQLQEWVPGGHITLKRNPMWWGGEARVDDVVIKFLPTAEAAYNAYLAGEVDAAVVPGNLQAIVEQDPILKREQRQLDVLASFGYFLDNSRPPFADPGVRRAVSMAIDRDAFVRESEAPDRAGHGWLPPGMAAYEEDRGSEWEFDPEGAREALAEAGFPGGSGLSTIEFAYIEENPLTKAAAEFFQSQLETNLGISVELQPLPRADWIDLFIAGELQVLTYGHAAEIADPAGFLSIWTCQRYEGDRCAAFSGDNFSHYANPEFDRVLQQALKETNEGRRERLYAEAEEILVADAPAVFLGYETRSVLVKPYVLDGVHTPLDWLPFEYFLDQVRINN